MVILADPLEGVRSVGAVVNDAAFVDCGCGGAQHSRPRLAIEARKAQVGFAVRRCQFGTRRAGFEVLGFF